MTPDDLKLLKGNLDKVVQITCVDGEVIKAKLISVSEREGDIVLDLISTNREDKHEKLDRQPAYLLRFVHISNVKTSTGLSDEAVNPNRNLAKTGKVLVPANPFRFGWQLL